MIDFRVSPFASMLRDVTMARERLRSYGEAKGATQELKSTEKEDFSNDLLPRVVAECKRIGLEAAVEHASRVKAELESGDRYSYELLEREMNGIRWDIERELKKVRVVLIPSEVARYLEQPKLFGEEVYQAFPEARNDISDAGNCLATGLTTATVFHLMRVAEFGLRRLSRKLKVRLRHKGAPCPIEFADWQQAITGAKAEIEKARQLPAGPRRQEKLERLSDAADQCMFMKDIWRNTVSHARKPYNGAEALGILERVRDFMQSLASNF